MFIFDIPDMSCNHCVASITQAIQTADPKARITVDLAQRRITVDAGKLDAQALHTVLTEAGYNPINV